MTELPLKRLADAVIEGVQARYQGQAPLNFDAVAQLLEASSQRGASLPPPAGRAPVAG